MDLKTITDKLNEIFRSGERLVFWYDAAGDFAEDINGLSLDGAKVLRFEPGAQLRMKYLLERQDTESKYLIYAPYARPDIRGDHLADTLRYSREFFADLPSLICADLGIPSELKPVVVRHIKFFTAKERAARFYELKAEVWTEDAVVIAMLSALCRAKSASFEETLRETLCAGTDADNKYFAEFAKFGLAEPFWRLCRERYGFADAEPTLRRLMLAFFITFAGHFITAELPANLAAHRCRKAGSVVAFMDNMMNNVKCGGTFDVLSASAVSELDAAGWLSKMQPEELLECEAFAEINDIIIKWIVGCLMAENTGAKLLSLGIPEICRLRAAKHFGEAYKERYAILEKAFAVVGAAAFVCPEKAADIAKFYTSAGWRNDAAYRVFYLHYDRLADRTQFEPLRERVEAIYTNVYLDKLCGAWSGAIAASCAETALPPQQRFWNRFVDLSKGRVIVIISDALRYEAAAELAELLARDEKCSAQIEAMAGVLPSVTKFGMAALLPHQALSVTKDFKALIDGRPCESTEQREAILQAAAPKSRCLLFDDVMNAKREELRPIFADKDVIYIYHNQIDARGDKANTENEVFAACEEAISEIYGLIRSLTETVSARHFIVTADHGFIYKRDKVQEYDKLEGLAKGAGAGKRYVITGERPDADGICSFPLSAWASADDKRTVSVPCGVSIFKTQGGGLNYVHGGASPQEMIVPIIDVKTLRGRQETKPAQITVLMSAGTKITSLMQSFEFFQTEPVTDVVKEAVYRIYFTNESGGKISNENVFNADIREADSAKRIVRFRFTFKNRRYGTGEKFYLVVMPEGGDGYREPLIRQQVIMDVAFADDFGF